MVMRWEVRFLIQRGWWEYVRGEENEGVERVGRGWEGVRVGKGWGRDGGVGGREGKG